MDRVGAIRTGGIRPARVAGVAVSLAVAVSLTAPGAAGAAEVTRVVTGFDDARRFDFNITLSYLHDQKQADIDREQRSASSSSPSPLVRDLLYRQTRDIVAAHIEMGLLKDLGLHFDLPYVVRDDRSLEGCSLPVNGTPTCSGSDSTLVRDGILPGLGQTSYGVDARSDGAPFQAPSTSVFQGPRRSGLESLGVGLSWAPMNQARDENKPTWLMGVDAKFDVASTMRYDAARPGANTGVGLGYHQLLASTFVSKRHGSLDPYFGAYYLWPITGNGSPFAALPVGSQPHAGPQPRTGAMFGLEVVPWERAEINQRVALEIRLRADHRFQGSSHSELWEPLSGASTCRPGTPAPCRAGLDLDLDGDGTLDHPYPGVSETQAYSTFGGDVGLSVQAGKFTRFRGLFGLSHDLPHFITFATAGSDRNGDGRVDSSNLSEANPAYRELIDIPGRRFRVEGSWLWNLSIELAAMF